jgi:alpha-tubulin suppressor-like RCC1 family protein
MRRIIFAVVQKPILVAFLLGAAFVWSDAARVAAIALAPASATGLVTAISAGDGYTCAVKDGGAWCWGYNADGQLGNGTTTDSVVPVAVSGLTSGVSAISTDSQYGCAVKDGVAWCWGANSDGQLGDNSQTDSDVPVKVSDAAGFTNSGVSAISAGYGHACVLKDGGVWCWGYNGDPYASNPTLNPVPVNPVPVEITGMGSAVTAISAGYGHTCAVKDGGAWCWGYNGAGQLGNGSQTDSDVPVKVSDAAGFTNSGVSSISAGHVHTCALKAGGAWCWGETTRGQLGDGSTERSPVPVAVSGLTSGVIAISAGSLYTCALREGGAWCWGSNDYGELGNSIAAQSSVPVAVTGLASDVSAISAGIVHTCAQKDGASWCWGNNGAGQLGNNSTTESRVPVEVQWPRLSALPPGGSGPGSDANGWIWLGVSALAMGALSLRLGIRRRRRFRSVFS